MTKEFLIKSLLPYKENPQLCGYENGKGCVYLTKDGRKCAIGQYIKENVDTTDIGDVTELFEEYKPFNIMTDEWLKQNVSRQIAINMQLYHDFIAGDMNYTHIQINNVVNELENLTGFNLDKLKYYEKI